MTRRGHQICPGLNANEIQIPYDKHHKESSLMKSHQNTRNSVKYEVIRIKTKKVCFGTQMISFFQTPT